MNNTSKNIVCLICGENISFQIDLKKQTLSTDCKNNHHFRNITLSNYVKFLPAFDKKEKDKNDNFIFYCYICHKNITLSNIGEHNGHDGIKLSIDEFLDIYDCSKFNRNFLTSNFDKEINEIEKVINDCKEWKKEFDKRFNMLINFYENIYQLEKIIFNNICIKSKNNSNNFTFDYELLTNIKEIYRINKIINNNRKSYYQEMFNNNNFNQLSNFIMNKINEISEVNENAISNFKDISIYYKDNKCFFNEEIKNKIERKDNLFPSINNLFKDCKHMVGYDARYFTENFQNNNIIKFNNNIFQEFLLKIKRKYPKINHLSHMRDKSFFLCSIEKIIIIIKTNLFDIHNIKDFKMEEINIIDSFNINDLSDIILSIELNNRLLLSISEKTIYIYESIEDENDKIEDFYKNYFLQKTIKIKNTINDAIQISSKLFCTYSLISEEINFYDIPHMEIVTKFGEIEGTPGCSNYMIMITNDLLSFMGDRNIMLISVSSMEIRHEFTTTGLISSFCLLPNNGILCGEIIFDFRPKNPWIKDSSQFNLVQYQINDNGTIKKLSEKINAHKEIIHSILYLENNVILSCSNQDDVKIWY